MGGKKHDFKKPRCKDGIAQFTAVPSKVMTNQVWIDLNFCNFEKWLFYIGFLMTFYCMKTYRKYQNLKLINLEKLQDLPDNWS